MQHEESFLSHYFTFARCAPEVPNIYHRWCILSGIGAILSRNFYFQHGNFKIFPNSYIMLIGEAGARKSTAIKLVKKLIGTSGYTDFAANKTTKEKFLVDLQREEDFDLLHTTKRSYDSTTANNLWGDSAEGQEASAEIHASWIVADEVINFLGRGNIDFCNLLGELWDFDEPVYRDRIKNGRSVTIPYPVVHMLAGTNQENFTLAFPPEIMATGYLSRNLLIYGEPKNASERVTFPTDATPEVKTSLAKELQEIKQQVVGSASANSEALVMLDEIYQQWKNLSDIRFRTYSSRRFTQLIKILLSVTASHKTTRINAGFVTEANTYLAAAEQLMSKALGEFGKGKHGDIIQRILGMMENADKPIEVRDIWKEVHRDLDKPTELAIILQNLEQAEKIIRIPMKGFLARAEKRREEIHVNWNLLSQEERSMIGL